MIACRPFDPASAAEGLTLKSPPPLAFAVQSERVPLSKPLAKMASAIWGWFGAGEGVKVSVAAGTLVGVCEATMTGVDVKVAAGRGVFVTAGTGVLVATGLVLVGAAIFVAVGATLPMMFPVRVTPARSEM